MNRYDSIREHSKRSGEYRWWDDGQYVDLDKLDLQSPADLQELRGKIETKFDAVRSHLHYRMDQSNETDLSYQDSHHAYRLRLRHGYMIENEERTPVENSIEDRKQHWVTFVFGYRNSDYLFGPRGKFYGDYHMSLGSADGMKKFDLTLEQVELMLILARIVGPRFEGFQNRVADSQDHYHVQYLHRVTTIWDAALQNFPATAELLEGRDLEKLAVEVMRMWAQIRPNGIEVDLLFRSIGTDGEQIILLPRERPLEEDSPKKRPSVAALLDETFEANSGDHMGDFGVLEMAGYLGTLRSVRAFEFVARKDNRDRYARAIHEVTYPRTRWERSMGKW